MDIEARLAALAKMTPELTLSATETLIAVNVEDLMSELEVPEKLYFMLRDLADAAMRRGLHLGLMHVSELYK